MGRATGAQTHLTQKQNALAARQRDQSNKTRMEHYETNKKVPTDPLPKWRRSGGEGKPKAQFSYSAA
jgi:hypothetical protein